MKRIILLLTAVTIALCGYMASASEGHGEEAEENSPRFGPGKAVIAFDKDEGFQLSAKATKNLGVEFSQLRGNGPWKIPAASLVRIKQSTGVYRRYEKWVSFILVKVMSKNGTEVFIHSPDLEPGDEVATSGAQFLRMTDADLNSGTVDNCAH